MAVCVLLLSTHCAGRASLPGPARLPELIEPWERRNLGRIAVVLADDPPSLTTGGYVRGKCKGAAAGAGRAVLGYLGGASSGGDCGDGLLCALYYTAVIALVPVVALGGAIAGAAGSVSKQDVRRMKTFLREESSDSRMQRTIREHGIAHLPDGLEVVAAEAAIDERAADTLIEIGSVAVSGRGSGGNTPVLWEIAVHARLVRASDGAELQSGRYTYHSCGRKLRRWVRDDLALLRAELRRAYESLGEKIADEFLAVEPIGPRGPLVESPAGRKRNKPSRGDPARTFFGLRAIEPATLGAAHTRRSNGLPRFDFTRIDSARPTLRWESFRPAGADADLVKEVTYELRIARSEGGLPGEVFYRRDSLSEPMHRIEERLESGRGYFWTVRARFEVGGVPRVTEWGGIHALSRTAAEVPGAYSYRFETRRDVSVEQARQVEDDRGT